jgi:hypothetical protein
MWSIPWEPVYNPYCSGFDPGEALSSRRSVVSSSRTIDTAPREQFLKIMVLGAAGFWLPDTVLHALGANRIFSWYDARILTVVLPLTFLATFLAARRLQRGITPQRLGFLMLAGVWLFGGLPMMIGASFAGGGIMVPNGIYLTGLLLLLSLLPMYAFVMATYDGSQFALAVIALATLLVWLTYYLRKRLSSGGSGTRETLPKAA